MQTAKQLLKFWGYALALEASTNTNIPMKTENMPRITTDFDDPRKRIKVHDLRICTWNVRSLNRPGAVSQLETVLKGYKADITALQEMRLTGQEQTNLSSCDVYYSGHASRY